jgi:hypothetical protein
MQNFQQFVTEGKYFLGVTEDAPPGVGQFQIASDAEKKFDAQNLVKLAQLTADRLRRQVQLLGRARNAARFGNHPEVPQMLEIERSHSISPSELLKL